MSLCEVIIIVLQTFQKQKRNKKLYFSFRRLNASSQYKKRIKTLGTEKDIIFLHDNWVQRHPQNSGRQLVKTLLKQKYPEPSKSPSVHSWKDSQAQARMERHTLLITLTKHICNFVNTIHPQLNQMK